MTAAGREYLGAAAVFIAAPAVASVALYAWPGAPVDFVRGAVALTAIGVLVAYLQAGVLAALRLRCAPLRSKTIFELGGAYWLWGVGGPAAVVFVAVRTAMAVKDAHQLENLLDVNLDFLAYGSVIYGVVFGGSLLANLRRA